MFGAKLGVKRISCSAIVTRADGTVEDLGEIAVSDSNPFKQFAWWVKSRINLLRRKKHVP